jgi:Vacuole effluxer Atg22 like
MVRSVLHHRQGKSIHLAQTDSRLIWGGAQQSSSFIGPLVVGLVADLTGNIRYAFLFLVVMLWAAAPVLAGVDVERGRADARAWTSNESDRHEAEGGVAR